ncbi:putative quinol monooxygenase [Geminocystis herdmanii]|uniref:putative quinol monooxygenase n=1 Tax=Geminocystis herdmanii TaxID=669359 RepID=UPI0003475520|nr:putative quinol monooxygenase [Geminocystis herdmanii]
MSNPFIVLAGRYKIKPEKRERFLELAMAGLEPTRQESGNISYAFFEEVGIPNSFLYFEEWENKEALMSHLKQPYIIPLLDEFADLIETTADIKIYDVAHYSTGLN